MGQGMAWVKAWADVDWVPRPWVKAWADVGCMMLRMGDILDHDALTRGFVVVPVAACVASKCHCQSKAPF